MHNLFKKKACPFPLHLNHRWQNPAASSALTTAFVALWLQTKDWMWRAIYLRLIEMNVSGALGLVTWSLWDFLTYPTPTGHTYGVLKAYLVPNRKKLAQPPKEAEETSKATNSKVWLSGENQAEAAGRGGGPYEHRLLEVNLLFYVLLNYFTKLLSLYFLFLQRDYSVASLLFLLL